MIEGYCKADGVLQVRCVTGNVEEIGEGMIMGCRVA